MIENPCSNDKGRFNEAAFVLMLAA